MQENVSAGRNPDQVTSATPGGGGMVSLFSCITDRGSQTRICSSSPPLLAFFRPSWFFPQPIRAVEGFSTRVSQTSVWPADGSISIQRNPRHQQLLHKEKGNQGKSVGTAFPEGSVCPWPGILLQLSMSETSCQSVHDLLLFPSLMNPRWV